MSEWTQDRIDLASRLWLSGVSAKRIAEELGGLTRNAVMGKIDRLGLLRAPRGNLAQPAPSPSVGRGKPPESIPAPARAETRAVARPRAEKVVKEPHAKAPAQAAAPAAVVAIPASPKPPAGPGEPVQIMDLRDYMCKWPLGDPSSESFRYCGHRKHGGAPYCEAHVKLAYMPSTPRLRGAARASATARR